MPKERHATSTNGAAAAAPVRDESDQLYRLSQSLLRLSEISETLAKSITQDGDGHPLSPSDRALIQQAVWQDIAHAYTFLRVAYWHSDAAQASKFAEEIRKSVHDVAAFMEEV